MPSESFGDGTQRGKRKVTVTHHFETEIDVDKLDDWVDANIVEGRAQVMDEETGEVLYDGF